MTLPAGIGERAPWDHKQPVSMRPRWSGRYRRAKRTERVQLLDEFVAMTGRHRKYAIALLGETNSIFTRSRPYHKNDNAHVEQKNWTHVRRVFGWKRFDSHEAVRTMNELYANEVRLLMNYFQTSVKLVEKTRVGSRVVRRATMRR